MQEMLKDLGLDKYRGEYGKDRSYVIELTSDTEFGKVYTILDNSADVDQAQDSVLLTVHNSQIIYYYKDEYQLVLTADFDNNIYSLICSKFR